VNAPLQGDLFAPAVEPEEERRRRVNDLLGRAFEQHCHADEQPDTEAGNAERAKLRAVAVKLEREADDLIPVEQRTWLR
jgi:hypothetical protein